MTKKCVIKFVQMYDASAYIITLCPSYFNDTFLMYIFMMKKLLGLPCLSITGVGVRG
jgi:hypothetical protein